MENNKFDLEERTAVFAENVIKLCKAVKNTTISQPILSQLIRSSTGMGANYREANGASSNKDFKNKIYICKKEAKETEYWLRILIEVDGSIKQQCQQLLNEAHELTLIFSKIASSCK